ncbi:MAG: radical SAM protein, partial [Propionivibrio sp.]
MLKTTDHSRESAGLTYVYPVISRRAGGVSVGININVNNACNWACIYCQVPDLVRGGPPPVNLELLESELTQLLTDIVSGDFLRRQAPPGARQLMDVAISGNGEPTSAADFSAVVERVGKVMRTLDLPEKVKLRLITNGSFMHRPQVRAGIARIGALGGEVWFKLDRATDAGIERINRVRLAPGKIRNALLTCADLAPTWIQTCYFAIDGNAPDEDEQNAYLDLVGSVRAKIKGVLLYGL